MRLLALVLGLSVAGAQAADPAKILRITFQAAETGFDPVKVSDYYSGTVISAIFDPLLTYDYLARPAKLVPNTAVALPDIDDGGKTYTVKVRPGIYFADDPVFKSARRELTALDYAYSIRRFLDPKNHSPYAFLFEGIAGIETPERHTLVIRLKQPDYNFSHVLAFALAGAVAREAIESYGDESAARPVGTGPFRLKRYVRSSKIVLEANPGFRELVHEGQRLPRIGGVEISIMEETQSRWLAFQRGDTDLEYQLAEVAPTFITAEGKLKPELARKGIRLERTIDPEIIYLYFNMQDKTVGGLSKERVALRRAIAMAYKIEDQIRIIRKGQSIRTHYPIPPGVAGHDPAYRSSIEHDPRAANALLDRFGYRKGPDGYRRMPNGEALVIRYSSTPSERDRQFDELMKRSLDSIAVRLEIHKDRFPELIKLENQCRLMMRSAAWIADYPDGDNFMQLLYGPNSGQSNNACYRSAEYDRRYEQSRLLPDGAERDRLYREMARIMEVDTVWLLTDSRYRNVLMQPHVKGFTKHPVLHAEWLYIDLELPR
ncbi:MAG TPA: ABC transporter substrate-binding protein [Burkholderiales bacterium]|nr:ABC transporter substrate-binding protein [Burkholderiales bacterium]